MCLRFLSRNIYDRKSVVAPILQLRLTVKRQKLKYKVKIMEKQIMGTQIYFTLK